MAKILITGGSGRVGNGILLRLDQIFLPEDVIYILMHTKPIGVRVPIEKFYIVDTIEKNFDFALHIAAQAETPFCKKIENREAVIDANVALTKIVSEHAKKVVYISTNQVFDGNSQFDYLEYEEAHPLPGNFYGESKLQGEKIVLEHGGIVVRLDTVLGVDNRLITSIIQTIRGKDHPPFWTNTFSRPTHVDDLVKIVREIYINETATVGIFHCACSGRVFSRADFAKFTLEFFKQRNLTRAKDSLPEEVCTIPFPRRLVLSTNYTQKVLKLEFMDSEVALEKHLTAALL